MQTRERERAARWTVVGLRARKSGRFVQRTRSAGTRTAGESTFHSDSTSSRRPTSSKHATHARPNGLYYIDSCTEQNGGRGPRVLYTRPECKNGDSCSSTETRSTLTRGRRAKRRQYATAARHCSKRRARTGGACEKACTRHCTVAQWSHTRDFGHGARGGAENGETWVGGLGKPRLGV